MALDGKTMHVPPSLTVSQFMLTHEILGLMVENCHSSYGGWQLFSGTPESLYETTFKGHLPYLLPLPPPPSSSFPSLLLKVCTKQPSKVTYLTSSPLPPPPSPSLLLKVCTKQPSKVTYLTSSPLPPSPPSFPSLPLPSPSSPLPPPPSPPFS